MPDETPAPYLLLKLRTCDEFDTWLRPVPGKVGVLVYLTMAYHPAVASLRPFSHVEVNIANCRRLCALLSVEPVLEPADLVVKPLAKLPADTTPLHHVATSWVGEFVAPPDVAKHIAQLADLLERRETTQHLALSGVANSSN